MKRELQMGGLPGSCRGVAAVAVRSDLVLRFRAIVWMKKDLYQVAVSLCQFLSLAPSLGTAMVSFLALPHAQVTPTKMGAKRLQLRLPFAALAAGSRAKLKGQVRNDEVDLARTMTLPLLMQEGARDTKAW
jgi:hypothetical protein